MSRDVDWSVGRVLVGPDDVGQLELVSDQLRGAGEGPTRDRLICGVGGRSQLGVKEFALTLGYMGLLGYAQARFSQIKGWTARVAMEGAILLFMGERALGNGYVVESMDRLLSTGLFEALEASDTIDAEHSYGCGALATPVQAMVWRVMRHFMARPDLYEDPVERSIKMNLLRRWLGYWLEFGYRGALLMLEPYRDEGDADAARAFKTYERLVDSFAERGSCDVVATIRDDRCVSVLAVRG